MQITVNKEKIEFELENEKSLFDVIDSLRSWLHSEGFVLTAAAAGDRELDLIEEEGLRKISIDEVETLHINAQTELEKAYDDLAAVSAFFRILKKALQTDNREAVDKVLESYPYVHGGLDSLLGRQGIASETLSSALLHERMTACGLPGAGNGTEESLQQLFAFIDALKAVIESRMHELENPNTELAAAAAELRDSVEQLSEVSVMLQTGRDQEAMEVIIRFAELSSRIIRLYPSLKQAGGLDFATIIVEGTSFPDFYAEFNGILSELLEAFAAEDSVLIGDLLEYEVSPRLEKLKSYIDLLTGA